MVLRYGVFLPTKQVWWPTLCLASFFSLLCSHILFPFNHKPLQLFHTQGPHCLRPGSRWSSLRSLAEMFQFPSGLPYLWTSPLLWYFPNIWIYTPFVVAQQVLHVFVFCVLTWIISFLREVCYFLFLFYLFSLLPLLVNWEQMVVPSRKKLLTPY